MTTRARLSLTPRSLERLDCDVAVAAFFRDERPLRGGAARADWRLCGQLSRRIERGDLAGDRGEAMLISAARALRAPRLMVLGLGARHEFSPKGLRDQTEEAVRRSLQLRCHSLAMAPFGIAPDDVPRHAGAILAGVFKGIEGAPGPVHIQLSIRRSEIPAVERAFLEAMRTLGTKEIELDAPTIEPSQDAARRAASAPVSRPAP